MISADTASAAEVFGLMLRNLSHVTLMGSESQGEFSDTLNKHLANGWRFSLSNEDYFSPSGEWFEHRGLPVEQTLSYGTPKDREQNRDSGLESAHTWLLQR